MGGTPTYPHLPFFLSLPTLPYLLTFLSLPFFPSLLTFPSHPSLSLYTTTGGGGGGYCCVGGYLNVAQWLYLARLPSPHDDADWSSWYLSKGR